MFNIECEWDKVRPAYRIFVNDELFTERTWNWDGCYIEELLQIEAPEGMYIVRLEAVQPTRGRFTVTNHRIESGPARWLNDRQLEIVP